ncbi:MAG TPA: hypothetical protein VFS77_06050 [Pyrinomonadaceae bacterium]|nr:hypothetical protein [Pyrinomonadaceae bacterium]
MMAAEHLSNNQLVGYAAKKLNSEELLAVDRHLASCDACHDRLTRTSAIDRSYDLSNDGAFHLDYDQHLVPYVEGTADEIDREIIESHVALCSQCAEDIRDLQEFTRQPVVSPVVPDVSRRTPPPAEVWQRPRIWTSQLTAAVAIAIFLLGITAGFLLWASRAKQPVHQAGPSSSPSLTPGPSPDQIAKQPSPEPSSSPRSELVFALNDGGRQITIDEDGLSTGLESLPPDLRTTVENVLASRKFYQSPAVRHVSEGAGRMRGGSDEQETIVQLSPAAVVIETDLPAFRWRAFEGASDYVVTVHDSNFRQIESSGAITGTEWVPPRPLPRGVVYSWQVRASVNGQTVISPKPPAPEVRFRVLDQKALAAIESARRTQGNSHLAMGVLYWKHGLMADAERELEALARANPNSTAAAELLRSLRSLRQ